MGLEEADLSMTQHAFEQTPRQVSSNRLAGPQPGDDALLVRFYKKPVADPAKTKAQGRPIYAEIVHIDISRPGDRNTAICRAASDNDKARFPKHWEAYSVRNNENFVEGTLLADWPAINRAQVEELAYFKIRTVEQLSKLADSNVSFMRGIVTLKQRALTFLAASKDSAAGERLNEELQTRDAAIGGLKQDVSELKAIVAQMQAAAVAPAPVAAPSLSVMPNAGLIDMLPPDALVMEDDEPEVEAATTDDDTEIPKTRRRRKRAEG